MLSETAVFNLFICLIKSAVISVKTRWAMTLRPVTNKLLSFDSKLVFFVKTFLLLLLRLVDALEKYEFFCIYHLFTKLRCSLIERMYCKGRNWIMAILGFELTSIVYFILKFSLIIPIAFALFLTSLNIFTQDLLILLFKVITSLISRCSLLMARLKCSDPEKWTFNINFPNFNAWVFHKSLVRGN